MARYFGVISNRDYIKIDGERRPIWEFLDRQPDGWLSSLAYKFRDIPPDTPHIFDCGAWSYKALDVPKLGRHEVTPAWVLGEYKKIARPNDLVVAPDHMLIPGMGDLDARRVFNRLSAAEFVELAADTPFRPMAVVHGATMDERLAVATTYVSMGYRALALGGLAGQAARRALCIDVVTTLRAAFPDVWLHVLGLSAPRFAAIWQEVGVESFDGSSHFKQAFAGGGYFIADGATLKKHQAAKVGEEITAPECDCTVCARLREHDIDTRRYGSNEHNMGRAVHNMNHLMRAQQCAMQGPPPDRQLSLSPA